MNENKTYHYECTEDPNTFRIFETSSYELVAAVYGHAETTKIVDLLELETELRLKYEKIKMLEEILISYTQKDEDQSFLDTAAIATMNSIINNPYTPLNNVDLSNHAELAYIIANALLAEKKRLQSDG